MKELLKILKKIRYSYRQTDIAFNKVRKELFSLGIFTKEIDDVEVEWQQLAVGALVNINWLLNYGVGSPSVMGYCTEENRICIPEFGIGRDVSVQDVLRHEFGHVYANLYPKMFVSMNFKKAFGDKYGEEVVYDDNDNWKDYCVSPYAASSTQEDFAETFMYYLKHKGKIPSKFKRNRCIVSKWGFLDIMVNKLAKRKSNQSK